MKMREMDNAYKWLNMQIKAEKMRRKSFESITVADTFHEKAIQITNLEKLAKILDIEINREDWCGNDNYDTNWDYIYFLYHGYKFFELTDKSG